MTLSDWACSPLPAIRRGLFASRIVAGLSEAENSASSGGFLADDAPDQSFERVGMGPEIDAMKILQRPRQLWHYRRQGQDYRNDGAFALHELVQKCLKLLILPRSTIAGELFGA